jgi:hypothetical protein
LISVPTFNCSNIIGDASNNNTIDLISIFSEMKILCKVKLRLWLQSLTLSTASTLFALRSRWLYPRGYVWRLLHRRFHRVPKTRRIVPLWVLGPIPPNNGMPSRFWDKWATCRRGRWRGLPTWVGCPRGRCGGRLWWGGRRDGWGGRRGTRIVRLCGWWWPHCGC